jgi:glyoxylase-like metal-dependent hydrolase (beta-lactamase superfamily II)
MQARIDHITTSAHCWLIGDDDEVIVVDPGDDAAPVLEAAGDREVIAVICTHGHARHVAAAVQVAKRDDAPIALHRGDLMWWRESHPGTEPDIAMEDGGTFEVADVTLEVIHSPGHTAGSVCLYCEDLDALLAGDVVSAAGPCGHDGEVPDFPGQLSAIGAHVLTLPEQTQILPGHGPELSVADAARRFDSWAAARPGELFDDRGDAAD